ncbi:uncharacterized protein BP01DRAFT_299772 [Aspergillus saccharolyticus JOP 1030-1]|uniref:Uncharacterized protein n=1 Tax=Aspergillus saccharolyticus JOP 1030-1 TaxID=1450539 RepID=A0A318Z9H8_9EURO|nr:hypothetical protein BP01DRAFT_299772 [Aspergillus saccharolyticus JOP 1030-1]PYH43996.1 hypothetical protein BP01DRAFT_299772 [Aspergillus saccharolyticus JOP 1030-1]
MASLKRFFHAEKHAEKSPALNQDGRGNRTRTSANVYHSAAAFEATTTQVISELRPSSPYSRPTSSHRSSQLPDKIPRHVDLLDALFTSHRYHIQCPTSLSPITPYNEDIAERNMAFFLKGTFLPKVVFPRPISYQGDVARNRTGRSGRSLTRSASTRSHSAHGLPLRSTVQSENSTKHWPRLRAREGRVKATTPEGFANTECSPRDDRPKSSNEMSFQRSCLRSQRSAPDLAGERPRTSDTEPPTPDNGYLGVPPAHKQGNRWSNTPLPDSPTIPLSISHDQTLSDEDSAQGVCGSTSKSSDQCHSASSRRHSKKNVRDLSINIELAARRNPNTRATHRAMQPPTPKTAESTQHPSIAEFMNSPLPVGSPTAVSPLPPATEKVAEIMDMFRQAYTSPPVVTLHPTLETLQDAIVREINSHDAFKRLTFSETEGSATPSPSQESFDRGFSVPLYPKLGSERGPASAKEGQLLKLIRKSSFRRHKRNSEQCRSISTSVPSTTAKFQTPEGVASRRRHTDAPLPSNQVLDKADANEENTEEELEMPMTYMDLLLHSESETRASSSAINPSKKEVSSRLSAGIATEEHCRPSPSILYMRAQGSDSLQGSRSSFSDDESDEEIIQLPSLETPEVRIQGVDYDSAGAGSPVHKSPNRVLGWPRPVSTSNVK